MSRKASECTFFLFFFNFASTYFVCQVIPSHICMCALHYSSLSPSLPLLCLASLQYPPSTLGLGSCAQPLQENCFQLWAVTGSQPLRSCSPASARSTNGTGGERLILAAGCLQKQLPKSGFGGCLWTLPAIGTGPLREAKSMCRATRAKGRFQQGGS